MPGPEGGNGGFESREGADEKLCSQGGRAGCLRWAVRVKYDAGSEVADKAEAARIMKGAVVAYTSSSFELECGGPCEAGCELVFSDTPGEPPSAKSLIAKQGITSLEACEQL